MWKSFCKYFLFWAILVLYFGLYKCCHLCHPTVLHNPLQREMVKCVLVPSWLELKNSIIIINYLYLCNAHGLHLDRFQLCLGHCRKCTISPFVNFIMLAVMTSLGVYILACNWQCSAVSFAHPKVHVFPLLSAGPKSTG